MMTSGQSFRISESRMARVTPRAFASYDIDEAIPRSLPVTTGLPRNAGFFATSHDAKNESPSTWSIARGKEW